MNLAAIAAAGVSTRRPAAIPHAPLPPFDPSDSGGTVHTTPPPELVIPPNDDNLFMRADFNGVVLDTQRWGTPPMLIGANSNFGNAMLMTPMLILYPRRFQDAALTEHAERGYRHFVLSADGWNLADNGLALTTTAFVQWAQYVQSWGFRIVYWRGQPWFNDPFLQALVNANCLDWSIPGTEVDRKLPAEQYASILNNTLDITARGVPVGAHLTANFPEGFPRDTFFDGRSMPSFADYNGHVHLCWQANQDESAGTQAARCYYARQRVNLGTIGGDGRLAPDSRVIAFETMATAQLYGRCTEEYGCLRSLELTYATRLDDRIRPMSGSGNGIRYPDGMPL